MINNNIRQQKIILNIRIEIAPDYLASDSAMLQLYKGIGDKNNSKYTEVEYLEKIKTREVIVAMLKEDPIAYAIIDNGEINEYYIEWAFKDSNLKDFLLKYPF